MINWLEDLSGPPFFPIAEPCARERRSKPHPTNRSIEKRPTMSHETQNAATARLA